MEQGAEKILAKHGCLYMKDDYKALFEELEAYYKPTEAVENNAVLPFVSGSTTECECRTEWLSHSTEYNVHPYGDNIEYDKCQKCGKTHNFKTF